MVSENKVFNKNMDCKMSTGDVKLDSKGKELRG